MARAKAFLTNILGLRRQAFLSPDDAIGDVLGYGNDVLAYGGDHLGYE